MALSLNQQEFIHCATKDGCRLDGRAPLEARRIHISVIDNGKIIAEVGNTKVFVSTTASVTSPNPDRPQEGLVNFYARTGEEESPRTLDEEAVLTRQFERVFRRCRVIDTEALCIVAGEKVWSIRVDIHVLNDDGNLIDCGSMAIIASILHFKRPQVSVEDEQLIIHSLEEKNPVSLSVLHIPISCSFAFINTVALLDPTKEEEQAQNSSLIVCLNNRRELCLVLKNGGICLEQDILDDLIAHVEKIVESAIEFIKKSIKA